MKTSAVWPGSCSDDVVTSAGRLVRRWFFDEQGQDLIEYALLTAAIGFTSAVAVGFLTGAMNTTYSAWDTAVQSDPLVEVPDPVGP